MQIKRGNLFSKLVRATDSERAWLQSYLTFEGKRIGAREAKPTCLFNLWNYTYPAGFDTMVYKAAIAEGKQVQFLDTRQKPCEPDPSADLSWLRDYQKEAVERAVARKRGILWMPTGSGKTEVIVALTRALPCKWLAVVHRSQLADDIASRYEKRSPGLVAGRILEGRWGVPDDATLVAATFQSLNSAWKKPDDSREFQEARMLLDEAQGFLVDEVHTLPAATFYALAMRTKNAYYRIGLSGTPLARGDAKSQYALGALGPVIHRIMPEVLIQAGVLARPTVRMVEVTQSSPRPTWAGVYSELIANSALRNGVLVDLVQRAKKPCFVFVEQVDHGHAFTRMLGRSGINAEFVYGTHSVDYRKSVIRRMVLGHFDVIVCSRVFNEGIDVPELRAVVNAGGMKSIIATLQRLGRGMRVHRNADGTVAEGGDEFEVWDIYDRGNKWTEKHARVRQASYTNEGYSTFLVPASPRAQLGARVP